MLNNGSNKNPAFYLSISFVATVGVGFVCVHFIRLHWIYWFRTPQSKISSWNIDFAPFYINWVWQWLWFGIVQQCYSAQLSAHCLFYSSKFEVFSNFYLISIRLRIEHQRKKNIDESMPPLYDEIEPTFISYGNMAWKSKSNSGVFDSANDNVENQILWNLSCVWACLNDP